MKKMIDYLKKNKEEKKEELLKGIFYHDDHSSGMIVCGGCGHLNKVFLDNGSLEQVIDKKNILHRSLKLEKSINLELVGIAKTELLLKKRVFKNKLLLWINKIL